MESVDEVDEVVEEIEDSPAEEGEAEEGDDASSQVDLDYDYAIARAAILLDTAGDLAVAHRSTDDILKVSAAWMALSSVLGASASEGDEEEEGVQSSGIGFVGGNRNDVSA
jgi:hypothetical protein